MKKLTLLAFLSWMMLGPGVTHATSMSKPMDPVFPETLMQMKAADFVKLTFKDFAKLSQHTLTLKEKIAFTVLKKKLKRELKKNPGLIVGTYLAENKKISTGAWIAIIVGVALVITIILVSTIDPMN